MPPELTPEERYDRLLDEAWWRFQRADRGRMAAIEPLLQRAADEITSEILRASTPDGKVRRQYLEAIQRRLNDAMHRFAQEYTHAIDGLISATAAEAWQGQHEALNGYLGNRISGDLAVRLGYVTQDVANMIHQRTLGGLNLSERIWQLDWATRNLLERDILNSVMRNESAADMARRIERYLLPGREVPRDVPSRAYSGQPADVSYNAYRLARTEINQTYHEVRRRSDAALADQGLALGTRWVLSPQHAARMRAATDGRTSRDICDRWAERVPGDEILPGQPPVSQREEQRLLAALRQRGMDPRGVYVAGKEPRDHPNGLCRTSTVMLGRDEILAKYGF